MAGSYPVVEVYVSGDRLTCPLETIGLVRGAHTMTESTPIQSSLNRQETGIVDVFRAYIVAVAAPVDLAPGPSA